MPTYEYECGACGHTFEEFQGIKDEPLKKCPKCGRKKLRRLIGAGAALLFKGSGFYITDYRSKEYKEKAKKEKPGGGEKKESSEPPSSSREGSKSDSSSSSIPPSKKSEGSSKD